MGALVGPVVVGALVGAGVVGAAVVGAGVGATVGGNGYISKAKVPPQKIEESPLQGMSQLPVPYLLKSMPASAHQHCITEKRVEAITPRSHTRWKGEYTRAAKDDVAEMSEWPPISCVPQWPVPVSTRKKDTTRGIRAHLQSVLHRVEAVGFCSCITSSKAHLRG